MKREVNYLGPIVSAHGLATDPGKVLAISTWHIPIKVKELQPFLGMVGYYLWYLEDFAVLNKPLIILIAKGVKWEWTTKAEIAL